MKLVYILGLEHSGTTLTDHLLSSQQDVIGLGEVASYFSSKHMRHYLEHWGDLDDHNMCSCGNDWLTCEFWAPLSHLNGVMSELPLESKYSELTSHFSALYGDESVLIDSSKSLQTIQLILSNLGRLNISKEDVSVVFCVKDVRSFAASMIKKSGKKPTLLSVMRSFNYWSGENKKFLSFLNKAGLCYHISIYELLCIDPDTHMRECADRIGIKFSDKLSIQHNSSHIAMGNKGFTMRNRDKVVYDNSWSRYWQVKALFLINRVARKLNQKIYRLAGAANK